jgi:hypothetical protein
MLIYRYDGSDKKQGLKLVRFVTVTVKLALLLSSVVKEGWSVMVSKKKQGCH